MLLTRFGVTRVAARQLAPSAAARSVVVRGVRWHSIHEKYAAKLAAKAKQAGVESIEDLIAQSKDKVEEVRKAEVADLIARAQQFRKPAQSGQGEGAVATEEASAAADSSPTQQAIRQATKKSGAAMDLDSFIDVAKFAKHDRAEIELLWKARFLNTPNAFSGAMAADVFSRLYINARKMPTFVLPLPHETHGVELHYVQWSFVNNKTVYALITSLAEYKLHNEYAHPHTTFMLHTDLAGDKQVVLTNAVIQGNEISTENAALLILNLQRFYTAEPTTPAGATKLELLHQFNNGDKTFTADKLIQATETLD